jgi:PAS domain S-box-containing protein
MEYRLRRADGEYRWLLESGIPRYTGAGEFAGYIGSNIDITEIKRAEEEHRAHLWFLESMDRVNRAIQGTNDLEQMMSDVLEALLSIFDCDRAWLVYPCDPEGPSWRVPMEHARPEFPGAFAVGRDLPVTPDVAEVFQTVRASTNPVRFGPGSKHPLPTETAARFNIQSMIGMAIYPKGDKPYMLGLHHCSYPRVWTAQEERLFQEIGRRLEDALTSLLIFRNLGESERKLEEAQRLTHVGYWDRDLDTGLITWSDETYRIYGLPTGEILTLDRIQELIHSEDRPTMLAAISAALRGAQRYDIEYRVIRPDGELRVVHSQADVMWEESGRARRMFGTVQDITERKRAEEELRGAESRFRTYVDHATDALFVHGDQRKVVDVNRQACESLGYTREELIGMTPRDFDPGLGVDDAFIQWMKERLEAGEVFAFETSHRRKDGTLFPVEVRVRPFWHGGHRFGLALVRDITERKRAEETLRQTQAELAHVARVATLGELAASIAHEVNQPLAGIVTNGSACLRWLMGDSPNLDEARETARRIIRDGKRASDVISRIRTLARKTDSEKGPLDINQAVREVVTLTEPEAVRKGVALRTELAGELPPVLGDRVQLQQVILNLVMNGIEAMENVRDRPRELLIRSSEDESDKVLVAVQDSGIGIDSQHLEKIFDTFYTTKSQGMGMGLAISRSIVENHGGRLWAVANDGPGATFQFTLDVGIEAQRPLVE